MVLVFNKKTWHYRLILWTFGKNFFMDADIDIDALEAIPLENLENLSYDRLPKKYTSKTVNLCPYCRALVGAVFTAPFVYVWRLFPHKEKPPMSYYHIQKAAKRRRLIIFGVIAGVHFILGADHLLAPDFDDGHLIAGIAQISIGIFFLTVFFWGERFAKFLVKLSALVPKLTTRSEKSKKPKNHEPSKLLEKIHSKHDVICPPIFFVDFHKPDELK